MASRRFFQVRVTILLAILFGVLLYAWHDVRRRQARKAWDHTLEVAVVLLERERLDPRAVAALRARLADLSDRLAAELARYRPEAPRPFAFRLYGPIAGNEDFPLPASDGIADLLRQSWNVSRFVGRVDAAVGLNGSDFDSRIYVAARPPANAEHKMVEGASEQDGRVGTVQVELDEDMVDFALIVTAHELFHTLGAQDHYDTSGATIFPDGLADPDRRPLLPQDKVEIMARNRPVAPGKELIPLQLGELAVGPATAREIGWLR